MRRVPLPFVPTRPLQALASTLGILFLLRSTAALAACDNLAPASGQSATCSPAAPNPTTAPVRAVTNSTNVTITIQPNAELDITSANAVVAWDRSTVLNLGTVHVTGDGSDGLTVGNTVSGHDTITNGGVITTNGNQSEGLYNEGAAITMLNEKAGVIQTNGPSSPAMHDFASSGGGSLTNNGSLVTTGEGSPGMAARTVNDTVVNNGTIVTTGSTSSGLLADGGQIGGAGNNTLINNGTIKVSGATAHGIESADTAPGAITNTGSITANGPGGLGALISGKVAFTNAAGASIVSTQANGIDGNGGGTYNNAGIISAQNVTLSFANAPVTVNNSGTLISNSTEAIAMNGTFGVVLNNTGNIAGGGGRAIFLDAGNDTFNWSGGTINGFVRLDQGNDTATLTGLTDTNLAGVPSFDGGPGTDALTFNNTQASGVSRFVDWETINVTNGSRLTLDSGGLTLGDSGTLTGTLNIDSTSSLFAGGLGDPSIVAALAGQRVSVNNAGTIDLTNGGSSTRDALVVNGNYVGLNGRLLIQTVLGADGAPSDKLVIAQGTGSGNTTVGVTNVGGNGGATVTDGIMVVQATGGATTTANAFTLPRPLTAGAFVYYLFKGGVSAGTADNWYLRSSLAAAAPAPAPAPTPTPTPTPAPTPTPTPTPEPASTGPTAAPGTPSLPPAPSAGAAPTPLYRMEVPVYAEVPVLAREIGIAQIATFHDRQGEQSLLNETGALPAAWGRVWGEHVTQRNGGAADPELSGTMGGIQVGHDLYADATASGHRNHYGFFLSFARAQGEVSGLALGFPDLPAGHLAINAYSVGGYWTHIGPGGWYTDAVLMGSTLTIDPMSNQGIGATTHAHAVTASLEGGLPVPLSATLSIEPQMQLVWQHIGINDLDDGISSVSLHAANGLAGRLGVRLAGRFDAAGTAWQPYARVNLWRYFGGTDSATFAGTTVIPTSVAATTAQFQLGIVAKVSARGSVFANAGYTTHISSEHRSVVAGDVGVRWSW
ncbi:MAG TPA: autotransporter outer membrane beta-barrel domain-containing protein [Paraburkholderia sp.]|nr:autotransporter outer membrane beta-barrel domain-containing protein [Paraburkholderia sp.]